MSEAWWKIETDDTIYRQAAIDAVNKHSHDDWDACWGEAIDIAVSELSALPSVEKNSLWENTEMWNFTKEHPDCCVKLWGGYGGKNDGYKPLGYQIDYQSKVYYFGIDGHFIKEKIL